MTTGYNALTIRVYSSGTTEVVDADGSLRRASVTGFSTYYPGGLYGDAEVWVPRDVTAPWTVREGYRLSIYNGTTPVWEGQIVGLSTALDESAQGVTIRATGYWGAMLGKQTLDRAYADDRIDQQHWVYVAGTTGCGNDKCDLDRDGRLRFTPKNSASWAANDLAAVRYTTPCGPQQSDSGFPGWPTRVTFSHELREGGQQWKLEVMSNSETESMWSSASDDNGTASVALSSGLTSSTSRIVLQIVAGAAQAGTGSTLYGNFGNVMVYAQNGNVTACTVALDVIRTASALNSSTACVNSPGQAIEPFYTRGREYMADVLARIVEFGDTGGSAWAAGVYHSDVAPAPNGAPLLYLQRQPALTDYDYIVRLDDLNIVPPLEFTRDLDSLANWVTVQYTDELNQRQWMTPYQQASLTDATSSGSYGRREAAISANTSGSVAALSYGQRYLAAHKDPRYYVSSPITVVGYIVGKAGQRVPASEVRAGQRIKIENYLDDLSGTGLTLLITGTQYMDASETVRIQTGVPDDLAVYLARESLTRGAE